MLGNLIASFSLFQVALTSVALCQSQFETNFQDYDVFDQSSRGRPVAAQQQQRGGGSRGSERTRGSVGGRAGGQQEEVGRQDRRETTTPVPILKQINE